ncbi:DUF1501 domain-containing protein [Spirilliplanes yamanashiensis]|uniref:DUF1501 domain-containing protein n=1 Tax=Spirilliplanes yamanashiensis TaxID=42233 RepID=A0A8J3Y620_9ACTN|nr:DUF1501 domain-containing protein [Spirilliplanes yamanashiensis]MDP9814779.1 uncharacterized protein (DUF1501 family) [Spirilliplanes yamanashiensis]GIJ02433.1 hypothetical protein Sya03_17850 [Spirilliplanes yamanashiensis]
MDLTTRRRFLIASGVAGAGALAMGAGALGLAELLQTADRPGPEPAGDRASTLVLVTLYGGNDGLNTVIPYADPAYHSARPELAYAPETVLRLDDALGLNPKLRGFKRLWDDRRLAVVLGVGYPRPDRSHFRSMDIWQTAAPAAPATTGWVGRWLDGTGAGVEAAVSFEPVLPPLLVGRHRIGACVSYTGLALPSWIDPAVVTALGRPSPGDTEMQARAAVAYADLLRMGEVVAGPDPAPAIGADMPMSTATGTGGDNALGAQLSLVARCVEAGVPTRVYSVSLGGFDTHADELDGQEMLLGELDGALTAFADRMAKTEAGRRVAVVVYSEFGRRVRANASDGTDHGTAGPVFVLGHHVAGGFYGEQPSLTDLDDGDLKATTDFRDVVATALSSVLDADPSRYIDDHRATLMPFLPYP